MVNFPSLFDVSAAGHLEAGESTEAGVREVIEELGLDAHDIKLVFLGYRVEVADQSNGQKNREYQAVHMGRLDTPLERYKPQREELAGLYWLPNKDGIDLFTGKQPRASVSGIEYDRAQHHWRASTQTVSIANFVPRIQNYYLTAHVMAERLLEGRFPLVIS